MANSSSFSSEELGRLNIRMSLSHDDCPGCGGPVLTAKRMGRLQQRCPGCGWEGPAVTPGGIKTFDEDYY